MNSGVSVDTSVRDYAGYRVHLRAGSVDEQLFDPEYQQVRFFPDDYQISPNATLLDIGAHIGMFAVVALARQPSAVVHAVEAGGENYAVMVRTVEENGLEGRLYPHHLALSDTDGSVRLMHGVASWGHTLDSECSQVLNTDEEVRSVSLRTLLDDVVGADRVEFMKMNIEGAEYLALPGSPSQTLSRIDRMLVELHPTRQDRIDRLIAHIEDTGFHVEVETTDHPDVYGWMHARLGSRA